MKALLSLLSPRVNWYGHQMLAWFLSYKCSRPPVTISTLPPPVTISTLPPTISIPLPLGTISGLTPSTPRNTPHEHTLGQDTDTTHSCSHGDTLFFQKSIQHIFTIKYLVMTYKVHVTSRGSTAVPEMKKKVICYQL